MKTLVFLTSVFIAALVPSASKGAWPVNGQHVAGLPVSEYATTPFVAQDGHGGAIIVWAGSLSSGESHIYAQRFNNVGIPQWGAGGVPVCEAEGGQGSPFVAVGPYFEDLVVVAWEDFRGPSGSDIYAQRLNMQSGMREWESDGVVISGEDGAQVQPRIALDPGGATIVFRTTANSIASVSAVRVTAASGGDKGEIALSGGSGAIDHATVTVQGGMENPVVVVVWSQYDDNELNLYAAGLSPDGPHLLDLWGNENGPAVPVCLAAGGQRSVALTGGLGGPHLAWVDGRLSPTQDEIYAQYLYADDGAPRWAQDGVLVSGTGGGNPTIAAGEDLSVVVAWESGFPLGSIWAQKIGNNGSPLWPAGGVSVSQTAGNQWSPIIVRAGGYGSIITWLDDRAVGPGVHDLYAQMITPAGAPAWTVNGIPVCAATGDQYAISVTADGAGGAIAAWEDYREGPTAVYAQRIIPNGSLPDNIITVLPGGGNSPNSLIFGCPKGDGDSLDVRLDFDDADVIQAIGTGNVTLQPPYLPYGILTDVPIHADAVASGYVATIGHRFIMGRGTGLLPVYLDGHKVAEAQVQWRGPDLTGPGGMWPPSPSWPPPDGRVDFFDFEYFGYTAYYQSPPNEYSEERDFDANHDVTFTDFLKFVDHYQHVSPFTSPLQITESIATSAGTLRLAFTEEQPLGGQHVVRTQVILEGVEPFTTAVVALVNENPLFRYLSWTPDPSFDGTAIGTEVTRDGVKQMFLGAVRATASSARTTSLGTAEFAVDSTDPVQLTPQDFELVIGDLLGADGDPSGRSGPRQLSLLTRQVTLTPATYRNELAQNYPNPFNPTTTLAFSLAKGTDVDLRIFDVRGALVKTLVSEHRAAGVHRVPWDGVNQQGNRVASGVYFYKLVAGPFTDTKKLTILK